MKQPFALTQRVNFIVSIVFIFIFGLFMTITVVHAIDRSSSILNDLSTPVDMNQ